MTVWDECSAEAELTELEFVHETVVGGEAAGDDDTEEYRPTRGEASEACHTSECWKSSYSLLRGNTQCADQLGEQPVLLGSTLGTGVRR